MANQKYSFLIFPDGSWEEQGCLPLEEKEGFFETMYCFKGSIPLWPYHFRRITDSLKYFHRKGISGRIFKDLMSHLTCESTCRVKLIIYLLQDPKWNSAFYLEIIFYPFSMPGLEESALHLGVSQKVKLSKHKPASFIKSIDRTLYDLAEQERMNLGVDELILLNEDDKVAEAINANIFVLQRGVLYTPPLSSGCIRGVARSFLLSNLRSGIVRIAEKDIHLVDVLNAEVVFLTNALRGVRVVSRLEDTFFDREKGVILATFFNRKMGFLR